MSPYVKISAMIPKLAINTSTYSPSLHSVALTVCVIVLIFIWKSKEFAKLSFSCKCCKQVQRVLRGANAAYSTMTCFRKLENRNVSKTHHITSSINQDFTVTANVLSVLFVSTAT